MTVVTTTYGYGEAPYGEFPYGTSVSLGNMGWQATFVIEDQKPVGMQADFNIVDHESAYGMQTRVANELDEVGMQAEFTIVDHESAYGMQSEFNIVDHESPYGMQSEFTIADHESAYGFQSEFNIADHESAYGMQSELNIVDHETPLGMQSNFNIADFERALAMEFKADTLAHASHGIYGTYPYGTTPYGAELMCAFMGMQAEFNIVDHETPFGMQSEFNIVDHETPFGMQSEFNIVDHESAYGMQIDAQRVSAVAFQALATIYNTTNLRIMCEFPSRGASTGAGLNAWGNTIATGENWISNSTETGDFSPFNLNTDIVEQVWRSVSTVVTGINLDCDTEIAQGVFLDTLAILNHNLTRSATVTLIGANDSLFTSINSTNVLQYTEDNIYYIAPDLPTVGSRYWRISIDDVTNPDGYLSIGTIIFGASEIFLGECFVDQVDFGFQDFADTVPTEGFTNASNSRALKRSVSLEFRSLNFSKGNFEKLRNLFKTYRTILKCLYVPTPSDTDMEVTDRYAVFGKLTSIPRERHNSKGPDLTYVDVTISIDESL